MIHIEVVGQNTPLSRALADAAIQAAEGLGVSADVGLVDSPGQVAQYDRLTCAPALLIDGAVVCTGSLASPEQIQDMIVWRHPHLGR
jgi:hypothetical protein